MSAISSLRSEQKEAIALLQVGTFLEYFDLMLYVHMAVFLNEIFFPKSDSYSVALLGSFSFCSTYILRPFGAIFFGWLGDHVGRKSTVIVTTMMMAISCIIMANLPTYAEIGVAAAIMVTFCRVLQGLSTLGEKKGAEIYLTEMTKPPIRYPAVSLLIVSSALGTMAALGVASLFTIPGLNWRAVFWVGALIAIIGVLARTRLRETPDFIDMKRRMEQSVRESANEAKEKSTHLFKKANTIWHEKTDKKTLLAFFLISCAGPVCFYFSYIYCGNILKTTFNYSGEQVIHHNFILSIIDLVVLTAFCLLSYKMHPLKMLKLKAFVYVPFFLLLPLILTHITSPIQLLLIQALNVTFALTECPASAVFIIHFPVFRRFTYYTLLAALASALLYTFTSFGFVFLTEKFGEWGLLITMIPINIAFLWGLRHFSKLEQNTKDPYKTAIAREEKKLAA